MSGYSPATDPTQRMAELEQLGYQKPAEIVGHLAATEDALFAALDIIDSLATGGVRSQSPPQFVDFLGGQGARAAGVETPFLSPDAVLFRRGYERQIRRLHRFV
ncbi:MAG: hypothetical protein OXI79_09545 [Gammaproteobacteria bacterium]|nr:hypothetical protein [Gammaproteobacteria bacterium]